MITRESSKLWLFCWMTVSPHCWCVKLAEWSGMKLGHYEHFWKQDSSLALCPFLLGELSLWPCAGAGSLWLLWEQSLLSRLPCCQEGSSPHQCYRVLSVHSIYCLAIVLQGQCFWQGQCTRGLYFILQNVQTVRFLVLRFLLALSYILLKIFSLLPYVCISFTG